MATLKFTIDSHLLQELGERLVGRPYIALAELVKNAYDADANHCEIAFVNEEIHVIDDGHGMTLAEFRDFWMRIGTTHKQKRQTSKDYGRTLTGSKGIGRLAVQFLGKKVEVVTTSRSGPQRCLRAVVDWDKAKEAGDLTKAEASYRVTDSNEVYAKGSARGTKIVLKSLNHAWSYDESDRNTPVSALAREVWMLRPPFYEAVKTSKGPDAFQIELRSADKTMEKAFRAELLSVLDVWDAKIHGEIRDGRRRKRCDLMVQFRDGDRYSEAVPLAVAEIDRCDFEIRIFKLYGKQPGGIRVEEARRYFKEFGGVHVYDGGFRLPYYGIDQDWLRIQSDHAHRRSVSSLLPSRLNVPLAMHDLPTIERIFGVVRINTARELRNSKRSTVKIGEILKINIGRDRLVDNSAYEELRRVVRWAIDYYATRYQLRQDREISRLRPKEAPETKLSRLQKTISEIGSAVPKRLREKLVAEVTDYCDVARRETAYVERQAALLAPLAAAGLATLAFSHERSRRLQRLERLVKRMSALSAADGNVAREIRTLSDSLRDWIKEDRESRGVFASLTTTEDRDEVKRFRATRAVRLVLMNTRMLLRGVETETTDIPDDLLLPLGTMAEWQALFQNVFVNASNAMWGFSSKRMRVSGGMLNNRRDYLRISDTGIGVDVPTATELFEPFVRRLEISDTRRAMGLGGTGLGLTIVRMICETRRCQYEFTTPECGFAATFQITWMR